MTLLTRLKRFDKPGFRLALLCLLLVLGGMFLPLLVRYLTEGSAFEIRELVIAPTIRVKQEEIQLYLKEFIGKPLYGVNLGAIEQRTLSHPWVKSVKVRRAPPHALFVDVEERIPTALISLDRLYMVDDEGHLFKPLNANDELKLPTISGANAKEWSKNPSLAKERISIAVEALRSHHHQQDPGGDISEVSVSSNQNVRVHFVTGLEVVLGKENFHKKWDKLSQILHLLRDKKHELSYAYLDDYPNSNHVAVRFRK